MPSQTRKEKDHAFVECSIWADDVKGRGGAFQAKWHFVDKAFLDQGDLIEEFPAFKGNDRNITDALNAIDMWFMEEDNYKETYQYKTIMSAFGGLNEDQGLSVAMRLLIHYIADIHQPLHGASRVNKKYSKGDRGGNNFGLPMEDGVRNLHSAYDSVLYQFSNDIQAPFSRGNWEQISFDVDSLMTKHPAGNLTVDVNDLSPDQWA